MKDWIILTALASGLAYMAVTSVSSIEFTLPDLTELHGTQDKPADFDAKFIKVK